VSPLEAVGVTEAERGRCRRRVDGVCGSRRRLAGRWSASSRIRLSRWINRSQFLLSLDVAHEVDEDLSPSISPTCRRFWLTIDRFFKGRGEFFKDAREV
jgi:hypothetical protein